MSNDIFPIEQDEAEQQQKNQQKPSNSAFKQQKLSAWQPILTVGTVLPTFFLIGVAFIPIGIGLLISSYQVQELEIDYTSCEKRYIHTNHDSNSSSSLSPASSATNILCSEYLEKNPNGDCSCIIDLELDQDYRRDVFLYYGLTNFYQNHRRYVKSRDDYQLLGHLRAGRECSPFAHRTDPKDGIVKPIAPCGAIANSLFNDTFQLERLVVDASNKPVYNEVPLIKTGIAWATDKNKFKNPPIPKGSNLALAFNGTVHPANWPRNVYELDTSDANNNGFQNEGFIVWMRTAAFPTFRKLYARIRHDINEKDVSYQEGLPKGKYRLHIQYNYHVAGFKGKKRFIISNTSWLGGRNPFIGAVYILIGLTSLILSGLFLIIHKKFGTSSVDNLNITPQTPFLS